MSNKFKKLSGVNRVFPKQGKHKNTIMLFETKSCLKI